LALATPPAPVVPAPLPGHRKPLGHGARRRQGSPRKLGGSAALDRACAPREWGSCDGRVCHSAWKHRTRVRIPNGIRTDWTRSNPTETVGCVSVGRVAVKCRSGVRAQFRAMPMPGRQSETTSKPSTDGPFQPSAAQIRYVMAVEDALEAEVKCVRCASPRSCDFWRKSPTA
jgi:hypothetical protein